MKITTLMLDGGSLQLGPLLARDLRQHKTHIDKAGRNELNKPDLLFLTTALVHLCAVRVNPSITLDQVESLIDLDNMLDAYMSCWGVSLPESPPGELLAPAAAISPSATLTGTGALPSAALI